MLNDKSDPPKVSVEDIYEVYYFQDKIEWQRKILLPEGFVWDERVVSESTNSSASSLANPLEEMADLMEQDIGKGYPYPFYFYPLYKLPVSGCDTFHVFVSIAW